MANNMYYKASIVRKAFIRRCFTSDSKFLTGLEKRNVLALTTWFCSPDLGMQDYEVLIRSSAFIVKSNLSHGPGYHVVTSSHNLAPWRFPKYYPEPFLEYVNEGHIHYTLEVRNSEGESVTSIDIIPNSFHHPSRDIGIAHFDKDEAKALSIFKTLMFEKLDIERYKVNDEEEVEFHGHEVSTNPTEDVDVNTPAGKDLRLSIPRTYAGRVLGRSAHQTFCRTLDGVLSQGMCGGPVIGQRGTICGLIEGIVPPEHPDAALQGTAVIIDSIDIMTFVENVERVIEGSETKDILDSVVHLRGGEVAYQTIGVQAVAEKDSFEDPFENIMKRT
mmetsp:Transcript_24772/g.41903  ORF Transcript_24772/g.41903 Transcript_24772/m.41903 type:complete len:331 (-) Transcript_24772:234-1226(-)